MELWQGELGAFIEVARGPTLAASMARSFAESYRRQVPEAEYASWERSLSTVASVAEGCVASDVGVLVEYSLPLTERRIDVMLFGQRQGDRSASSLLIELKRWTEVSLEDAWARNVLSGGAEHVHPSEQALDYAAYLRDAHSSYSDTAFGVQPCAFCHDMSSVAALPLLDDRFATLLAQSPLFLAGDDERLADLMNREIGGGGGLALMHQVRSGRFRPSRSLVQSLDAVLNHDEEWHLLDEQRKAFNAIWAEVQRLGSRAARSAILVRGGPGTGKSVIAVQLLAEALKGGLKAVHSTGGKAFTTVMKGTFTGAKPLFAWNKDLRDAPPMGLDLLLADEAHRIRKTSDTRWTKKSERGRRSQIDEMIDASKVSVFFLDEHQYMRPDEIGSTRLVVETTANRRISLKQYDLSAQFRCGGSREYVDWVDYLLGFIDEPPDSFRERYTFEMAADADDLEAVLVADPVGSSRLVAGFCWKWSNPHPDGSLMDDVVVGRWQRPWNRKAVVGKAYKAERHPYTLWATTPEGQRQVGCIYSAQGFEFDRVGVIWGADLVWRDSKWVGSKKLSKDPGLRGAQGDDVTRLLRHAYRVLLTRGVRGTRVLCLDPETDEHIRQCVGAAVTFGVRHEGV
jgi:uncharacterized protein